MTAEDLRTAIKALIASHPAIRASAAGHAKHAERYLVANGAPLGFEPERVRFQNIWTRADSVDQDRLRDIPSSYYDHTKFHDSKPNHDLYGEAAFKDADLICFHVANLWQAVRVVAEVAGMEKPK
jgi:hypothetical protein